MATVYYDGALLTFKQEAFHRFVPFSFFSFNLRSHYFPLVIAVFARLDVFFSFFFFSEVFREIVLIVGKRITLNRIRNDCLSATL